MDVVQTVQVWFPKPQGELEDGSKLYYPLEEEGWTPPNVLTYYAPVWCPEEEGSGLRSSTFEEEGCTPLNITSYAPQVFTADEEGTQLRKSTPDEEGFAPLNTTAYVQPPFWSPDEEGIRLRATTFDEEGTWPQPVAAAPSNPLWAEPEEYKLPAVSLDDDGWFPVNVVVYAAQLFTADEEGVQLRKSTFEEDGSWPTPVAAVPLSPNWIDEEILARLGYEEESWAPINTTVYAQPPSFFDEEQVEPFKSFILEEESCFSATFIMGCGPTSWTDEDAWANYVPPPPLLSPTIFDTSIFVYPIVDASTFMTPIIDTSSFT